MRLPASLRPAGPPPAAARAVLGLRRAVRSGVDRVVPTDLPMFELSAGVGVTHVLGALAELRVADAIHARGGRASAAEIAADVGADADALHRLMRAAAALGVLEMDGQDGRCALTRLGATLRGDHPGSQRDWCLYMASEATTRAWAGLADAVRTGESAFPAVHGRSVWEHLAANPAQERTFAEAMRRLTANAAPALAAAYPWPQGAVVCDVAGGVGTLLAAVLAREATLKGVLVDAPGVLAQAEPTLAAAGVRERVTLAEGDIFGSIDARADLYLLKDVLHDWDDARCAQILAVVRAAAPPGARIVLVETAQERDRPHAFASLEDLQMLTQCDGGRQRSIAELHALLATAGLVPGAVRETATHALVEARVP